MNKELKGTTKASVKKVIEVSREKRRILSWLVLYMSVQMNTVVCKAAAEAAEAKSVTSVTNGLNSLKMLIIGVIATIGSIYLGKSVMEFASSYQNADSSGMNSAIKGIVGGGMMIAVDVIIGFFQ